MLTLLDNLFDVLIDHINELYFLKLRFKHNFKTFKILTCLNIEDVCGIINEYKYNFAEMHTVKYTDKLY